MNERKTQEIEKLDKIAISVKSHRLLKKLLKENPKLEEIMVHARNETEALIGVRNWVMQYLESKTDALDYYKRRKTGRKAFEKLKWEDYAAIRILDYIDNAGKKYEDLNLRGKIAVSNPIKLIWLGVTYGTGGAKPYFFEDMLQLFRQFAGKMTREFPEKDKIHAWMNRFPSGIDPRIIKLREENRERILKIIISKIDSGAINDKKYFFSEGMSKEQKFLLALEWWKEPLFHLRFAVRSPEMLNELLGESLDPDTMDVLFEAREAGIPFFVNPYYLSLLHVRVPYFAIGADLAIRDYIIYSKQLIEEFGYIVAWEKEDQVKPGQPNAAGWILPNERNVHRRYPEVAILIPDSMGRACGGLCASCQRMYDFQRGNLNFNLDKLKPKENWSDRLKKILKYWEKDTSLRDILITGGDALMSSDRTLKNILDGILEMTINKKEANKNKAEGEKHAEILRVRLGTRLPVYLPQRISRDLCEILKNFKEQATHAGIRQFVIQTHFESPMELTPESKEAVKKLHESGWIVINQLVFSSAASRRGHTAQLRKVLNDIGVLAYYTFSVKGYMENYHNFATNARAVQEQIEEKPIGRIPEAYIKEINDLPQNAESIVLRIDDIRKKARIPFLATDRNVINLPGVGKSLTFRVVGITRYGRRILEFDHDKTRNHSPIIDQMGKVIIIESKSISEYLNQLSSIGENIEDYQSIWGYSIGETEPRMPLYEYPDYAFAISQEMTNLVLD
jgi:lysine 2,3-aminomutase